MAATSFPVIELSTKVALVTGAGSGLGLEIAHALSAAGARVAINDLDHERAEAAAAEISGALAVAGDVTCETDVASIVRTVTKKAGGLDILVNNAGRSEPVRPTIRQTLADWRAVLDVNLQGPFLMSRAVAELMGPAGRGAIVNVASVAGLAGFPASNAYGVSKAGLAMLTKTLACELARYGIRVNAVAPGILDAPMAGDLATQMRQSRESFERRIPMGRIAHPSEIAEVVAFLASDLASYITGVVLPVDGGWTAFGGIGDASRPAPRRDDSGPPA